MIHHFQIENELITQAEFIIPTMHCVLAIQRAQQVTAERYIDAEWVDKERYVGCEVYAFVPYIACSAN